ncbi:metal ABC transporter permease [Devosia sp. RR2S18]|uniref:metal ABC transporter permease n=1 Tax=Devosia rhizosphaerae TaxID=3049774 RepID=UPI002541E7A4|nr:metal ABC transporter permease [Devosia sp. RR2S18]WIJ27173.1 metal ABC transporter permease [Devosia sp. RR2S18]
MTQAMAIAVMVAIPTALLSCFLVLKGWSLMGDAISHAVLPGVVLAYMAGLPLGVGAFAAGMACALSVGFLKENSRIKEDTVMGVVFAGLFGLGIVLYTSIQTDVHLDHILFGDILGVSAADLWQTGIIALLVTALVLVKWKDLLLFSFDPQQAGAIGLPTRLLHYGLLAMLSLTIVAALTAVGIILVIALLVAPGAIAFLLSRRFAPMMLIATTISVLCSLAGIYLSFFIDSAPAPTIVLLMSATFVVAFVVTSRRTTVATV